VMSDTGPERPEDRRVDEPAPGRQGDAAVGQSEPREAGAGAPLPFGPPAGMNRSLRIGGVPVAKGRTGLGAGDEVATSLAVVQSELAALRALGESSGEASTSAVARTQKDIAAIKDSIEHVEAFLSISLVQKLDQALDEKLTVVQRLLAARRRLKGWLLVSLLLNLALAGALVAEAQTGAVLPALQRLGAQLTDGANDAAAAAQVGARSAIDWISRQF